MTEVSAAVRSLDITAAKKLVAELDAIPDEAQCKQAKIDLDSTAAEFKRSTLLAELDELQAVSMMLDGF